ncbi:MAG: hypothetical protein ABI480_11660 [Chitinophagaceae bacterium]
MDLDHYQYDIKYSFFEFEFISVGPKGKVRKKVKFLKIGKGIYNFSFADVDEMTGIDNDKVISNNGDRNKILATLANIIYDFTETFNDIIIYILANSASRSRLYQMNISKYYYEIEKKFKVFGYKNGKWQHFQPNQQYESFLVYRKTSLLQLIVN